MQVLNIDPEALSRIRQLAGMTQVQLALAAGISKQHLNAMERKRGGALPDVRQRIAEALGVTRPDIECWYSEEDRPSSRRKAA
jgi:transcriptional regulator with XRE-family HTH domain